MCTGLHPFSGNPPSVVTHVLLTAGRGHGIFAKARHRREARGMSSHHAEAQHAMRAADGWTCRLLDEQGSKIHSAHMVDILMVERVLTDRWFYICVS